MTTSRAGMDGTYNLAYGFDGHIRMTGDEYLREVHGMEEVRVYCELNWMYKDGSRWSFFPQMCKNGNTPVAELTVDGAWLVLDTRKLGMPSDEMMEVMMQYPRTDNFEWRSESSEKLTQNF